MSEQNVLSPGPSLWHAIAMYAVSAVLVIIAWLALLTAGTFFVRGCAAVVQWAWHVGR